jgi:hypothetical protein
MKETLGVLGLGALICLPCLALALGLGGAVFGGALVALTTQPLVQASGALLMVGGIVAGVWYARRRRACPSCGLLAAGDRHTHTSLEDAAGERSRG